MFSRIKFVSIVLSVMLLSSLVWADKAEIVVNCDKPTVELSEVLYGLFFEDINYGADGGLYAEMVQNRSFEYFPIESGDPLSRSMHPLFAWEKIERGGAACEISVDRMISLNRNNPYYLKINISRAGSAAGVANTGYDGMAINAGDKYNVSFYARRENARRAPAGGANAVTVALELADGTVCGSLSYDNVGNNWQKFQGVITATRSSDNARLTITTASTGTLYLDMVSMFPEKTFNGRKNGMRADLAQALKDLSPKFMRFPGGCVMHGHGLANVIRWKDTVGDVAERKGNWNRWGYHQTYGLGFFEYFQLCEDIGATALPVLPVGVSCGFTQPYQVVPLDELQEWIDDCTDLIEFANGPVDSKWGSLRAKMGHPDPFNLEYICLGNEEHDTRELRERFPYFVEGIRKLYPDIKIIGTSGLGDRIPIYDLMTELEVYSSDEHYYMSPQWFMNNHNRFDRFDRSKPLIFVGEYASQGNALINAVGEAAFLTGVERNGDMVDMTCYAPLFAHVKHTQWTAANLIHFDNRRVMKTPNYYVQQLFAANKGDVYLANSVKMVQDQAQAKTIAGSVGAASWNTAIEVENITVNGKEIDMATLKGLSGNFAISQGRLSQSNLTAQPAVALGSEKFEGQTVVYTMRARRTAGEEKFMLVFGGEDNRNYYWWNIGGWGNTQHGLEKTENGAKTVLAEARGSIENNTWYQARVELSPDRIKCFLNDKLIHDYTNKPNTTVNVSTTLDKKAGEIIVKLVNPSASEVDAEVSLNGVSRVEPEATLMLLKGQATSRNTIDNPEQVMTVTSKIKVAKKFDYTLPAMSVQFIRIKAQ